MKHAIAGLLIGACAGFGQTPAFEVASVRAAQAPKASEGKGGHMELRERVDAKPGSLIMANVRMVKAMAWAYSIQDYQVTGPGWVKDDRFDIVAKAATAAPENELRTMLQVLLADRFKVEFHRQTKEMSAYACTISKEGHKLKESTAEGDLDMKPSGPFRISLVHANLDDLASFLSIPLKMPVINLTGLKGRYDFSLDMADVITPEMMQQHNGPNPPADLISAGIVAVSKQLGIKIEQKKLPVEMLIIDRAERTPTEN